jgi:hypothetical protein
VNGCFPKEAVMMLAYRLVRLIETHSDAPGFQFLEKVHNSPLVKEYRKVPSEELRQRVYEIYRHLGDWLLSKSEHDIEMRYTEIGGRRAAQTVPLSHLDHYFHQRKSLGVPEKRSRN